jgi:hypothetical protein
MITASKPLLNGSSKLMSVSGSAGTPVGFSYSPGTGTVQVTGLSIIFKDEGATTFSNFGGLAALTNGLLIKWTIGGVDYTYATIRDNADLVNSFPEDQHFGSDAVLSILSVVTPVGFGSSNNVMKGMIHFKNPVTLSNADKISALVQDNLTAIDILQITALVEMDT